MISRFLSWWRGDHHQAALDEALSRVWHFAHELEAENAELRAEIRRLNRRAAA